MTSMLRPVVRFMALLNHRIMSMPMGLISSETTSNCQEITAAPTRQAIIFSGSRTAGPNNVPIPDSSIRKS